MGVCNAMPLAHLIAADLGMMSTLHQGSAMRHVLSWQDRPSLI